MISTDISRQWNSYWISAGFQLAGSLSPARPAPFFRKEFSCESVNDIKAHICGLGYYELYLNGDKVGDHVLDPAPTIYDRRARYVTYDLSGMIKDGANTIGVILGDGWYNHTTNEIWHFDKSPWRDYPKLICEIEADGKLICGTDESWKCLREEGPIRFNSLRNGEFYDARKEVPGWNENGFDDHNWTNSTICPGPGGDLNLQTMPPCRIISELKPVQKLPSVDGGDIYDMGCGIAGWAHIKVRGETGAVIKLRYSELLSSNNDNIDQSHIGYFVKSGEVQTDRYTLKGNGIEEWEPRFTFHGFNFVEVTVESGYAEVLEVIGKVVNTDFASIGEFEASSPELTKLFRITRRSFEGNFIGLPSDCPHREKNGWTGDALIASDTGLFNYDLTESYAAWIQSMADSQRPNGQLPSIVPTGGWGFNWGSGPVWDSAFIQIPYNVYIYRGDSSIIERNYAAMCRYMHFLKTLPVGHIIKFGLGDWNHHENDKIVDTRITSTGYYHWDAVTMAKCAALLGNASESREFSELATAIKIAFNHEFYHGEGIYAKGEPTALGMALELGLCPESEREIVAKKLAEHMEARQCRAEFGIVGAKYVPRALAANGYLDTACRIITQRDFPGWVNWLDRGAETLWEAWLGDSSRNHIMFGDIAAWMMQYLAGITPDESQPGFREITLKPRPALDISHVKASYRTPNGFMNIEWHNDEQGFRVQVKLPDNVPGRIIMPDNSTHIIVDGLFNARL